jgi:hypothetical protein
MVFPSHTLAGNVFTLDHLKSFRVTVPAKDPLQHPAILLVSFSHHVFSEKWHDTNHSASHAYHYDSEQRAFCVQRHTDSSFYPA